MRRRSTGQKRAILEYLRSVDHHPSASAIHDEVRKRIPSISLGTIYRTLGVLREEGVIQELPYDDHNRYDGRLDSHPHILCLSCGRVSDAVVAPELVQLAGSVRAPDFRIVGHRLEFFGYCSQCPGRD